jgi:hypothetical protein
MVLGTSFGRAVDRSPPPSGGSSRMSPVPSAGPGSAADRVTAAAGCAGVIGGSGTSGVRIVPGSQSRSTMRSGACGRAGRTPSLMNPCASFPNHWWTQAARPPSPPAPSQPDSRLDRRSSTGPRRPHGTPAPHSPNRRPQCSPHARAAPTPALGSVSIFALARGETQSGWAPGCPTLTVRERSRKRVGPVAGFAPPEERTVLMVSRSGSNRGPRPPAAAAGHHRAAPAPAAWWRSPRARA